MCACAAGLRAQSSAPQEPRQDSTELQVWSGAGHSVNGGVDRIVAWNTGLRYGWVLTNPHGPSILRGRFQYAVDWVPLYVIFQPQSVAYGAGFNPSRSNGFLTPGPRHAVLRSRRRRALHHQGGARTASRTSISHRAPGLA